MYLKVDFGERGDVAVWVDSDLKGLPLDSVARRWRHEIYFEAPLDVQGEGVVIAERGMFAYWKQGRALCIFHGFSQPYAPVVKMGFVVGSPDVLYAVEDGTPVRISEHVDYGREGEIANALRSRGLKAASHSWEGEERVGVLVEGAEARLGVEVFVEDEGFYAETQTLAFFDQSPSTLAFYRMLKRELAPTGIRPDVNDEGFIVLTCCPSSIEELARDLKRLLSAYIYAEKTMETFYAVRRPA
ncbi:MAG: cyclophilin-like family protein [Thermofilaceae archaeon]